MPTNLIPGSEIFTFGGIEFHGILQTVSDSREFRLVTHEFPKRDGALVESMGRRPHRAEIEIHFIGADFRAQLTRFYALVDENPKRLLVHPLLGQYPAACTVPRGVLAPLESLSSYKITATFTESALDARTTEAPSVEGARQKVLVLGASLLTEAAGFASALPLVVLLADATDSYATAGATVYETGTADPSLSAQLDSVAVKADAARAALLDDPATTTDARAFPSIALVERLYAACLELDEALGTEQPRAVEYVVQAPTTLAPLLQALYGREALTYLDAVLALNRTLPSTSLIAAGTRLTLPAAPTEA